MEVDIGGWLSIFYQFGSTCSGASFCPANHPLATAFTPRRLHPIRFAYYATIYLSLRSLIPHRTPSRPTSPFFSPLEKENNKRKKKTFAHPPAGWGAIEKDNLVTWHSRECQKTTILEIFQEISKSHLIDHLRIGSFEEGIRVKSPLESKVLVFRELTSRQRDARNARKTTRRDQTVDAYGISDLKTLCCFRWASSHAPHPVFHTRWIPPPSHLPSPSPSTRSLTATDQNFEIARSSG